MDGAAARIWSSLNGWSPRNTLVPADANRVASLAVARFGVEYMVIPSIVGCSSRPARGDADEPASIDLSGALVGVGMAARPDRRLRKRRCRPLRGTVHPGPPRFGVRPAVQVVDFLDG